MALTDLNDIDARIDRALVILDDRLHYRDQRARDDAARILASLRADVRETAALEQATDPNAGEPAAFDRLAYEQALADAAKATPGGA